MQQPTQQQQSRQRSQPVPAAAASRTAIQELQALSREFLAQTPRVAEAAADDEREAEEDKPAAGMDATDSLPLAISIAHRLCTTVLDRAPSASESWERAKALWLTPTQQQQGRSLVQHTVLWMDAAVTAGHQLSYLFVRLLSILVGARLAEATAELLRPLPGPASQPPTTFLQLLSGMLRLSDAPWMLRECIELLAVLLGVDEVQRTMLLALDDRTPGEMQQAHQARAAFVTAFLGPSGRSILSLVRHWSHESLSEETRLTLMRVVVALASTPPAAASAVVSSSATTLRMQHQQQQQLQQQQQQLQSPSIPARRLLAAQRKKWAQSLLPPLQSQSDAACRRAQILCIRELVAIIDVTEPVTTAPTKLSVAASPPAAAAASSVGAKKTMASRLPQSHAASSGVAAATGVTMMVSSRGARSHAASDAAAFDGQSHQSQQHWPPPVAPFASSAPSSNAAPYAAYATHR